MSSKTFYETMNEQFNEQIESFTKTADTERVVNLFNKTKETWQDLYESYSNQSLELSKKATQQTKPLGKKSSNGRYRRGRSVFG